MQLFYLSPKPKNVALKPKGRMDKEGKCFHYNETKHWKRNYKVYPEDLKRKKEVRLLLL